ncbi:mechanosensitive ion channel protein [Alteromonas halophila]|uniref:Small-conductance mechanosensitive channel n=2 Tax=Alteromonas halophila TaxID=516698 RepID=A0A918JNE4_9ALTE|nr:mechanosensitive ion channel domain-containing protein [Alteromonas halophila]GGW92310.1 mechanosensitive ion channel protein [Alteromonas halophila]
MAWGVQALNWLSAYQVNLIWTGVILVLYLMATRWIFPRLEKNIASTRLRTGSALKGLFAARVVAGVLAFALVLLAWGIDFSGLLVLSTSIITLTGVALFAQWSLISNITAYFILLTNVAYRRGNYLRIVDGDNYIEGYIADVGPFVTRLITSDRETVLYPNNLILTRPLVLNPKSHWSAMGKVTAASQPPAQPTGSPEA